MTAPMCSGPAVTPPDRGITIPRELGEELLCLLDELQNLTEMGHTRYDRVEVAYAALNQRLTVPGDVVNDGGDGTAGGIPWGGGS